MIEVEQVESAATSQRERTRMLNARRREAFDRLTQPRLEHAYRLASLLLGDGSEGEDAVHDAAVSAWLNWESLRDEARFDAWFDRILVNTCRGRLRARRVRRIRPIERPDLPDARGTDPFTATTERDGLRRALATLRPEHRTVVVLRFVDDLSVADIAARTGQREGTVKSRLHYALRELRAACEAAERLSGGHR